MSTRDPVTCGGGPSPNAGPVSEGTAGDAFVRIHVSLPGRGDDLVREVRRRRRLVPTALLQPVAHGLLVEARRSLPFTHFGGLPEAARVGRENFVADSQLPVDEAELELRVGDDDAVLERRLRGP